MDLTLRASADEVFVTSAAQTADAGRTYAPDFGEKNMQQTIKIMDMPVRNLIGAWERCIQAALTAKLAVEDELSKPRDAHVGLPRPFLFTVLITLLDRQSETQF